MQAVGANSNNNTWSGVISQNNSQVVVVELMGFLKSFGDAIVNHWQEESDARYAETLTGSRREQWEEEQFQLRLASARLKRRKAEADEREANKQQQVAPIESNNEQDLGRGPVICIDDGNESSSSSLYVSVSD